MTNKGEDMTHSDKPAGAWRGRGRLVAGALAGVTMTMTSFGAAYAYGIQNHTSNNVWHGCFASDTGCDDSSQQGDYNREGFTYVSGSSLTSDHPLPMNFS